MSFPPSYTVLGAGFPTSALTIAIVDEVERHQLDSIYVLLYQIKSQNPKLLVQIENILLDMCNPK